MIRRGLISAGLSLPGSNQILRRKEKQRPDHAFWSPFSNRSASVICRKKKKKKRKGEIKKNLLTLAASVMKSIQNHLFEDVITVWCIGQMYDATYDSVEW